jgi:hypothetical protein
MKKLIQIAMLVIVPLFAFMSVGCDTLSDAQKEALVDSGLLVAKSFGNAAATYYINEWLADSGTPPWAVEPTKAFLFELNATFDMATLSTVETTEAVNASLLKLDPAIRGDVKDALVKGLEDAASKTASNAAGGTTDTGAAFLTQTVALIKRE